MNTDRKSDPARQTTEEWLADYNRASQRVETGTKPVSTPCEVRPLETQFRYVDHRTTSFGSVVLEFESLNGSIRAVKFFNVKLKSTRGKSYPAGHRGQFIPPERGSFRHFWRQSVGVDPTRWCRVHTSMRSALGPLVFTGQYKRATSSKGEPYFKITTIRAM